MCQPFYPGSPVSRGTLPPCKVDCKLASIQAGLLLLTVKLLMTGPKRNNEFCFPETLNVPRGEAKGNIEVEGKQNSLFPTAPVIKCFVIPLNSKIEKNCEEIVNLLDAGWLTNLPRFQGARPDHVRVESESSCCFPSELVSFDPRHVTRSPLIGKRIWVGRYNKNDY